MYSRIIHASLASMNLICDFRPIRHTVRPNSRSITGRHGTWVQIAGSPLTDIAAGAEGTVWGVNGVGKIYRHVHA